LDGGAKGFDVTAGLLANAGCLPEQMQQVAVNVSL
jgi:hypothetical protein